MVDTNILISGLRRRGPEGAVVDAWANRQFRPCVSTALALEYESVLTRKLGPERRETGLKALQALLTRCEFVPIRFTYRPASPDAGDDLVVDCVLNSRAVLVTANMRDFRRPSEELGFSVVDARHFMDLMKQENEP